MRVGRRVYFGASLAAAIVLVLGARDAGAYTAYTQSEDTGNCFACHGDFLADPYLRQGVDQGWGTDLMSGHQFVITECDVCHTSPSNFYPVSTFSSGSATFDQSCLGCHGRFEDSLGSLEASGLRQHHWDAGITLCGGCHPLDSDPGVYLPVGEDVLPENYDVNLSVVAQTDPCNPGGAGEDFAGDSGGLDNDGDNMYDELDPDCGAPTTTTVAPTTTTVAPPTTTTVARTTTTAAGTTTTAAGTTTTAAGTTTTGAATTTTGVVTTTTGVVTTTTAMSTTTLPPGKKVVLCHKAKNTIVVGAPAMPAHLAHGDTLDECPDSSEVVMCQTHRNGKQRTVLVSQRLVEKRRGRGDTLGECSPVPLLPESTETPEAPESAAASTAPESTERPEAPESAAASTAPESTERPEAPESAAASTAPESTERPEAPESAAASTAPESTETPREPEFGATLAAAESTETPLSPTDGKVAMCHTGKNGKQQALLVSQHRVQARLERGFTLGDCSSPPE